MLSLAALLVIVSCGGGEQRRGTETSSTGGSSSSSSSGSSSSSSSSGGSGNSNSNRRFHKIQHGQCTYTFILPEGEGARGGSCREAKAGGPQHNANSLQRDAPPPEPEFPSQKIQQLEHIMENYTQWLQKVRRVVHSFNAVLNKVDQQSRPTVSCLISHHVFLMADQNRNAVEFPSYNEIPVEKVGYWIASTTTLHETRSVSVIVVALQYICFRGCVWSSQCLMWLLKITCFSYWMRLSN